MKTQSLLNFEADYPAIAAWWSDTNFDFALSLRDQVSRGKSLTERQLDAANRCVAKFIAARNAPAPAPVEVNVQHIVESFEKAKANRLLTPKMKLLGRGDTEVAISLAPAYGNNAGSLYVKLDGEYMGKITDGQFIRASACSDVQESIIVEACSDPEQAAVAYGRRFGICSICSRTLTNQESIDLGIGPICRGKFFG